MTNRTIPTRLALSLLALTAACATRGAGEPFTMVSLDEVESMLGQPGVAIIDANTRETFAENHLPGARWYRSAPSLAEVLPADKGTRLVFYCASPT